jgi:hypothetical protein
VEKGTLSYTKGESHAERLFCDDVQNEIYQALGHYALHRAESLSTHSMEVWPLPRMRLL